MNGFYAQVVAALRAAGFAQITGGKGSHEKWRSADSKVMVLVPFNCKSRHTANAVMKDAGIDKKF